MFNGLRVLVSMILTDYSMPDMTGYELLKKVKVIHHTTFFYSLPNSMINHACIGI